VLIERIEVYMDAPPASDAAAPEPCLRV